MKPKRTNRFYYPTGIISLILLPIICILYLKKHNSFEQLRIISVVFWDPTPGERCMNFTSDEFYTSLNYTDFHLTGNNKQDSIQLENARFQVRKLLHSKDTLTGVNFHFDDKAEYWTYIKAFEICKTEKAKTFLPHENEIWVFNQRPERKKVDEMEYVLSCGGTCVSDLSLSKEQIEQLKNEKRNEQIKYFLKIAKAYFLSIILWFVLVLFTIRRIYKHRTYSLINEKTI